LARSKAPGIRTIGGKALQPAQDETRMLEPPDRTTNSAAGATAFAETVGATVPIAGVDNMPRVAGATLTAIRRHPQAGTRSDTISRPERPAAVEGAVGRRLQSWNRTAGLELTDDLFEALYRNGVDVSWP
jgi:hypothetical protein